MLSNYSVRVDQSIGSKVRLFTRYSSVPSTATTLELGTANSRFGWMSATGGVTVATATISHDLRFNYSQTLAESEHDPGHNSDQPYVNQLNQSLFTALYPQLQALPVGFFIYAPITELAVAGVGKILSGQTGTYRNRQWEWRYTLGKESGKHTFQAGSDSIRLEPSTNDSPRTLALASQGTNSLLDGVPLGVTFGTVPWSTIAIYTSSLFVQDTFRPRPRLSFSYGVRWELTPLTEPNNSLAQAYFPYVGLWSGPGSEPRPLLISSYFAPPRRSIRYAQFAPRFALAYRMKRWDLVFRSGAGLFYETDAGSAINPANFNPLESWTFSPGGNRLPTVSSTAALTGPDLRLPRIWEWRTSVEKSVTPRSLVSASYVASEGQDLLRREASLEPNQILRSLNFTNNASSSYQAFLGQFRSNVTHGLYTLVSYTWAHSMDDASNNSSVFLIYPGYKNLIDRGASSFDVRHTLSGSFDYRIPSLHLSTAIWWLFANWDLSSTMQARTGFPLDVTMVDRSIGLGFENTGRADLLAGEPLWLSNAEAPGGRVLNPAAFSPAPNGLGNLGRNAIRGNGLFQFDVSLKRQFTVFHERSLEASLSVFNLFNHPEFSNPVGYLSSPLFGQSNSMANLMLGSGSPTTGLTPLFQAGGPRTVELGLKFTF